MKLKNLKRLSKFIRKGLKKMPRNHFEIIGSCRPITHSYFRAISGKNNKMSQAPSFTKNSIVRNSIGKNLGAILPNPHASSFFSIMRVYSRKKHLFFHYGGLENRGKRTYCDEPPKPPNQKWRDRETIHDFMKKYSPIILMALKRDERLPKKLDENLPYKLKKNSTYILLFILVIGIYLFYKYINKEKEETIEKKKTIKLYRNPIDAFYHYKACDKLRDLLLKQSSESLKIAFVVGPPGSGKTQLCRNYLGSFVKENEKSSEKQVVAAEIRGNSMKDDLILLSKRLEVHEKNLNEKMPLLIEVIINKLSEDDFIWILFFDNIKEFSEIEAFTAGRNDSHNGTILVTSKNKGIYRIKDKFIDVSLGFEEEESVNFLNKTSGLSDSMGAKKLSRYIGSSPLGLITAGMYIKFKNDLDEPFSYDQYLFSLKEKLKSFSEETREILKGAQYSETQYAVIRLSLDEIFNEDCSILFPYGFLKVENLPDDIVNKFIDTDPKFKEIHKRKLAIEMINELEKKGLINSSEDNLYSTHGIKRQVIQELLVEKYDYKEISYYFNSLVVILKNELSSFFKGHDRSVEMNEVRSLYAKQAITLLKTMNNYKNLHDQVPLDDYKKKEYDRNLSELLLYIGDAYRDKGYIGDAIKYHLSSYRMAEKNRNHLLIAILSYSLGMDYRDSKEFEVSKKYFMKSLNYSDSLRKNNEYLILSDIYHSYGICQMEVGDTNDAIKYFKESLKTKNKYSPNSPKRIKTLSYLGYAMWKNGSRKKAELYLDEAINFSNELGYSMNSNLDTATAYYHKAIMEMNNKSFDKANDLFLRVLKVRERNYGKYSNKTADVHLCLAELYFYRGDYSKALAHAKEAAHIYDSSFHHVKKYDQVSELINVIDKNIIEIEQTQLAEQAMIENEKEELYEKLFQF